MANPNPKEMFTDVLVHYETGIRRERERQKRERERLQDVQRRKGRITNCNLFLATKKLGQT